MDSNIENAETSQSAETKESKLIQAKKSSSGCIDFFFAFSLLALGAVGCSIVTALIIGIPIAIIVIAAIHWEDCPASPHIPIWLMEWGILMLARKCSFLMSSHKTVKQHTDSGVYSTLDLLIGWWPLIGGILVYKIYEPDFDSPESKKYCHVTLFKFSIFAAFFAIGILIFTAIGKIFNLIKDFRKDLKNKKSKSQTTDVETGVELTDISMKNQTRDEEAGEGVN